VVSKRFSRRMGPNRSFYTTCLGYIQIPAEAAKNQKPLNIQGVLLILLGIVECNIIDIIHNLK